MKTATLGQGCHDSQAFTWIDLFCAAMAWENDPSKSPELNNSNLSVPMEEMGERVTIAYYENPRLVLTTLLCGGGVRSKDTTPCRPVG